MPPIKRPLPRKANDPGKTIARLLRYLRAYKKTLIAVVLCIILSAVDTHTDAMIRKAFAEEIPNTTKLIIAQRVASVQDSDLILVMDNGTIAAQGTHDELMQTSQIYREVFESQTKGGDE